MNIGVVAKWDSAEEVGTVQLLGGANQKLRQVDGRTFFSDEHGFIHLTASHKQPMGGHLKSMTVGDVVFVADAFGSPPTWAYADHFGVIARRNL